MSNKEKILRNLEYLSGGTTAIKIICDENVTGKWHCLLDEWQDIIYNTIDMIEEDYELCQKPLKNSQS